MRSLSKTLAAVAASTALVISSTATAAVPAVPQQVTAPNAWLALASLSSSGPAAGPAIATCGAAAAAAAAQPSGGCVLPVGTVVPAAVPPPSPPPLPEAFGPHFSGELLGILIWLPLIAIALGTSGPNVRPNSPA